MARAAISRRRFLGGAVATATAACQAPAARGAALRGPPLPDQPIAIFSKHLQWLDYGAAAKAAAEAGFDALDIPVRPGGHVLPERVEEDLPRAVEAAHEADLQVTMITTAITNLEDPFAETVLKTAAGLGIGHYRMGYVKYEGGVRPTLDRLVPRWRELAALNKSLGIHGGYQNHSGKNLGAAIWDLLRVLEQVDSPWLGCQYDIRHNVAEGGYSWIRDLEVMAPFIHTLVFKDFDWERSDEQWRIRNRPLGEGMVPLAAFVEELRRLSLRAPISMHFEYPHPEAQRRSWAIEAYGRDLKVLRAALAAG